MTRARDFADVISGQFDIPAGSLGNAQSELSTLSTITTVSGSNDKVVLRDDTDGSMKLATITNAALQGPQGPAGADGAAGATGATGPAGADGAAGAAGTGNAVNVTHRYGNTGSNGWATRTYNLATLTANKKYLIKCIGPFSGKNNYNNNYGGSIYLGQSRTSTGGTYGSITLTGTNTQHFQSGGLAMYTIGSSDAILQFKTYAYYHANQTFYTYGTGYADMWILELG